MAFPHVPGPGPPTRPFTHNLRFAKVEGATQHTRDAGGSAFRLVERAGTRPTYSIGWRVEPALRANVST